MSCGVGLSLDASPHGWRVADLVPDGPAHRAGVQVGEVLVSVNGSELPRESLDARMLMGPAGTRLALGFANRAQPLQVELHEPNFAPQQHPPPPPPPPPAPAPAPSQVSWAQPPTLSINPQCGVGLALERAPHGFTVRDVAHDGPAKAAGLNVGDLIVAVDGTPMAGQPSATPFICGPAGTVVRIAVVWREEGAPQIIEVQRRPIGNGVPTHQPMIPGPPPFLAQQPMLQRPPTEQPMFQAPPTQQAPSMLHRPPTEQPMHPRPTPRQRPSGGLFSFLFEDSNPAPAPPPPPSMPSMYASAPFGNPAPGLSSVDPNALHRPPSLSFERPPSLPLQRPPSLSASIDGQFTRPPSIPLGASMDQAFGRPPSQPWVPPVSAAPAQPYQGYALSAPSYAPPPTQGQPFGQAPSTLPPAQGSPQAQQGQPQPQSQQPQGGYATPAPGQDNQPVQNQGQQGTLCGVGISLQPHTNGYVITEVVQNSTAALCGVTAGEILVAVDNQELRPDNGVDPRSLIVGPSGTKVTLHLAFRDGGAVDRVTLFRRPFA